MSRLDPRGAEIAECEGAELGASAQGEEELVIYLQLVDGRECVVYIPCRALLSNAWLLTEQRGRGEPVH